LSDMGNTKGKEPLKFEEVSGLGCGICIGAFPFAAVISIVFQLSFIEVYLWIFIILCLIILLLMRIK
jgi:hypothetical protein